MAYVNHQFGFHQPTEERISDRRPSYYEDDEGGVLDPTILETEIMPSPQAQFRRDSHANSNGVLTPAESHNWDPHYGNGAVIEPNGPSVHPTYHDEHSGFVRPHPPHVQTFVGQPHAQSWAYDQQSGHCTPNTAAEYMPPLAHPHFDGAHAHQYNGNPGVHAHVAPHHPHSQHQYHAPVVTDQHVVAAAQVQTPMSPHSHQDWMAMAQQEAEGRPVPKRMRPSSPPRTSVDLQRSSGVRKKNGRIDIPQDRNIDTIDRLIENAAQDEDLVKELKQQKRLLRNREAALASRQRKKKHTEELEQREKEFSQNVQHYEASMAELKMKIRSDEQHQQNLMRTVHELQVRCESMQEQNREMQLKYTEETSNLRKKVQILSEQLTAAAAPAMAPAPSNTGFTAFSDEFEALNMGEWDNMDDYLHLGDIPGELNDEFGFPLKPEPPRPSPVVPQKVAPVQAVPSNKRSAEQSNEQPVASGLLFFLLLCGAFVASKPANSRATDLPEVPDDVRAAAPTVLNSLLSDASPAPNGASVRMHHQSQHEPISSSAPSSRPQTRSRLDQLHRRITSPTKQQEIDQTFSLTTTQYASISNVDLTNTFHDAQQQHAPRPRPNLAETLAKQQEEHMRSSKAAVYTRSLLWDQIPDHIVRQFKQMVRDHNDIEARQQQQMRHDNDDMFAYKTEE